MSENEVSFLWQICSKILEMHMWYVSWKHAFLLILTISLVERQEGIVLEWTAWRYKSVLFRNDERVWNHTGLVSSQWVSRNINANDQLIFSHIWNCFFFVIILYLFCITFVVGDINFKVDKVKTGVNVTLYVTLPAEIPVQELTETRYILRKEALEGMIPTLFCELPLDCRIRNIE